MDIVKIIGIVILILLSLSLLTWAIILGGTGIVALANCFGGSIVAKAVKQIYIAIVILTILCKSSSRAKLSISTN